MEFEDLYRVCQLLGTPHVSGAGIFLTYLCNSCPTATGEWVLQWRAQHGSTCQLWGWSRDRGRCERALCAVWWWLAQFAGLLLLGAGLLIVGKARAV